jgi:hypothetical protein
MNIGTRCAFAGGGKLSWARIQGLPRQVVAASQRSVNAPSEPQQLKWPAEFGAAAAAEHRVAVRDVGLLLLAGFDRLVTAAAIAATARAAELTARRATWASCPVGLNA